MRQRFWILEDCRLLWSIKSKCIVCKRFAGKLADEVYHTLSGRLSYVQCRLCWPMVKVKRELKDLDSTVCVWCHKSSAFGVGFILDSR